MAVLSVTATPEPLNSPPRVRIDVTDVGNAPAITSVTVTRSEVASGRVITVRSNDGNPLPLSEVSASSRLGVIYDYEAPFGAEFVYSTLQQPDEVSATVVSDSEVPWLIHPGAPLLSQPTALRVGSFATRRRAVRSGVFYPLGRDTAVVVTDGRRKAPESSLIVHTETPAGLEAIVDLIDDAGVLLMNVPQHLGLHVATCYIAVGDVDENRLSDIGEDPKRDFVMPYVQVAMPTGGVPTSWTWADVMARYPTWQDLMDDNRTWADVMDPIV
jgi:hypothetical protein